MSGKRLQHNNSKGRVSSKGHDNYKPGSPVVAYSKPSMKLPGVVSIGKTREVCHIPYTKLQDNNALLPRYSAISSRSTEEPIGMDELDGLQLELESLLCNTALRIRYFQTEIESIDTNESRRERKGKGAGKQLQLPVKRKYQEEKPVKVKEHTTLSNVPKVTKCKDVPNAQGSAPQASTSENPANPDADKVAELPKNNVPYKFWNSVEPYCSPVTLDDIKFLESLLAQSSNTTYPPIPPLGRHYSEIWADERLSEDQNASNTNRHKNSNSSPEAGSLRKRFEKSTDNNMISGPLTQRLVCALLEEISMPFDASEFNGHQTPPSIRSNYRNSLTLEKCLRKELVEQGILDPEDLPPLTNPSDDEILNEIKKCQAELMVVRKENCRNLRNLIGFCKQEMIRVNMKKQLDQVDLECIETYKKLVAAKQKKIPITKQEREDAWKLISEQIRLNKEINSIPPIGPNSH